jgi:hypothetical protein
MDEIFKVILSVIKDNIFEVIVCAGYSKIAIYNCIQLLEIVITYSFIQLF